MVAHPVARVAVALSLLVAGCVPGQHAHDHEPDGPEPIGEAVLAATVAEAADAGCSTSSVKGLSLQIIAQAACIIPGSFVEVPEGGNLTFTDPVLPYLEQPAKDALLAALADKPATAMQVNSMLRTVAQQYLLYRWYTLGQCGIGLAAKPGSSNHETGLALDIQQYDTWKSTLAAHGFAWYGADDPVHFDYEGPGAVDYKGTDVLAFQVLWNKNHPEDLIDEDGAYGPQTEARLTQSPAEGFPIGPDCVAPGPGPDIHPALSFEDAEDDFTDGASAGRADMFVGDIHAATLLLTNKGASPAQNVDIGIEAPGPHLTVLDYHVETDFGHPGTFEENDANNHPDNPAHGSDLGPSFFLTLNAFAKGETKRVTLTVRADLYSIEKDAAPEVRFWVRDIPGAYHQEAFGGPADNIDASQTFGGGVLQLSAPADVHSHTQWLWDTDRREGWSPTDTAQLALHPDEGHLSLTGGGAGAWAQSPPLSLSAEAFPFIEITGRLPGGGEAFLYFATSTSPELNTTNRIPLSLPAGETFTTSVLDATENPAWTGTLTRVALGAEGATSFDIGSLRLAGEPPDEGSGGAGGSGAGGNGGEGGGGAEDSSGQVDCTCSLPGSPAGDDPVAPAALALALLGLGRLTRRRPR